MVRNGASWNGLAGMDGHGAEGYGRFWNVAEWQDWKGWVCIGTLVERIGSVGQDWMVMECCKWERNGR